MSHKILLTAIGMKRSSIKTLWAASLLLAWSMTSCISYKEIELSDVRDIRLNKVSGGGIGIEAAMQVKNPNGYKIKVKKIEADLLLNGHKVGQISLDKKVVLPRRSDQLQYFSINTQLSNVLSAVPSIMWGGEANMQLKGHVKGKVFVFSKKYPIEAEKKISAKDLNIF
jgi:LEA14-like dessication related protein